MQTPIHGNRELDCSWFPPILHLRVVDPGSDNPNPNPREKTGSGSEYDFQEFPVSDPTHLQNGIRPIKKTGSRYDPSKNPGSSHLKNRIRNQYIRKTGSRFNLSKQHSSRLSHDPSENRIHVRALQKFESGFDQRPGYGSATLLHPPRHCFRRAETSAPRQIISFGRELEYFDRIWFPPFTY